MHVILTILKILGIILLVLLGLLLVIVLSVLFVPVRYCLEGEKSSPGWSEANGKVRVSWLLHLIHLRIQYREKELDWECYLFGVPLKKAGAAVREWKKKRRKKMCMLGTITIFLAGAVCALFVLDKKEKISMSDLEDMVKDNVKKYTDKYMDKVKKFS